MVSPAPRSALVIGKALASSVRGISQSIVIYACAAMMGVGLSFAPERIALVGDHLNGRNGKPQLTGPEIAEKLGVSTASIYGHWKQIGQGKFVRKKKSARKRKEA